MTGVWTTTQAILWIDLRQILVRNRSWEMFGKTPSKVQFIMNLARRWSTSQTTSWIALTTVSPATPLEIFRQIPPKLTVLSAIPIPKKRTVLPRPIIHQTGLHLWTIPLTILKVKAECLWTIYLMTAHKTAPPCLTIPTREAPPISLTPASTPLWTQSPSPPIT